MIVDIPDKELRGFNDQAKGRLTQAVQKFVTDLIDEANRIESGRNTTAGSPEITSSIVSDADVLIRRGLVKSKPKIWTKILRIASAVLSLAVGVLYDSIQLQKGGYMLLFVIVIAGAIIAVTISTMKE